MEDNEKYTHGTCRVCGCRTWLRHGYCPKCKEEPVDLEALRKIFGMGDK